MMERAPSSPAEPRPHSRRSTLLSPVEDTAMLPSMESDPAAHLLPTGIAREIVTPPAVAVSPESDDPEEKARTQIQALIERTKTARPQSDADLLRRAYDFASEKHAGVMRKTGEPYIEHPVAVAGILAELGMDDVTLAAGLLHDVPEDCGVSFEEMTRLFGVEVAQLVDGVTKLKRIDFSSKQEKQAENLRKLFLAMAGDVRVIIVKLADRLHNMRTLDPFPETRKREIASETLYIFAPIAHRLGIWRVKWELEDRSFKFLEPKTYKDIYAKVQRTRAQRSALVDTAISDLQALLKTENIEAEVTGRPKHFYSIYQKMIKQGLKFDAIHDLIALRVLCNTTGDCYHALGMVHQLWQPVPEMFFDYIAKPKPNNYQSLHTKVLGPSGDVIEVQIRTRDMHREAEFGIAAHWRYKEGDGPNQNFGDKLRWLRLVLELQTDTQHDAEDFLDSLKLDLASDQVFVFTPRGDVIYLPQDSTPVDFAYRIHSQIGHSCTGAKVNGRIVPLSYRLHNGDIAEILTNRGKGGQPVGPKRNWLDFVVTPHAKNRIKAYLKKQSFEENHREGLNRLEKAAQAERLRLGTLADEETLNRVAKTFRLRSGPELIASIGYGDHSAESVLKRIRDDVRREGGSDEAEPAPDNLSGAASSIMNRRVNNTRDELNSGRGNLSFRLPYDKDGNEHQGVEVAEGERALTLEKNDLLYTLAKCCAPVLGDEVKGYTTRGRGVTVHRVTCSNLKHYEECEPDRLVYARWTPRESGPYNALVAVESNDRVGLLSEVTSLIAAKKINISGVNTYPLRRNRARLNIAVTVDHREQLDDLMTALRAVGGVVDVHRV